MQCIPGLPPSKEGLGTRLLLTQKRTWFKAMSSLVVLPLHKEEGSGIAQAVGTH